MLYVNIEQPTVTAVLIRLQYLGCSWSSCIISVHIRQRGRSLVRQPYLGYAQTWIQDSMLQDQEQDQDFQNTISRPRSKSRELHVWLCIKKMQVTQSTIRSPTEQKTCLIDPVQWIFPILNSHQSYFWIRNKISDLQDKTYVPHAFKVWEKISHFFS